MGYSDWNNIFTIKRIFASLVKYLKLSLQEERTGNRIGS